LRSYIKIYGPPVYDALKELEKIAIQMPQVTMMNTIIEFEPSFMHGEEPLDYFSTFSGVEVTKESIKKIIKSLEKIGIKVTIKPEIKIQNIVASGNIGKDLNLNILAMKLPNTEYEPEQFPGLVYKLAEAKATFLLFSNGKIVCTGTKSEKEVKDALDKLIEHLKKVVK